MSKTWMEIRADIPYEYHDHADALFDYPAEDTEFTSEELAEGLQSGEMYLHEIADGLIPVYTYDQLEWYSEDVRRIEWMEEALQEFGASSIYDILTGGLYLYHIEMLNCAHYELTKVYEEMADEEEEEEEEEE